MDADDDQSPVKQSSLSVSTLQKNQSIIVVNFVQGTTLQFPSVAMVTPVNELVVEFAVDILFTKTSISLNWYVVVFSSTDCEQQTH